MRPSRTHRRARHPLALLALLLAASAWTTAAAQERPLEALAPAETIVAVGLASEGLPDGDLADAIAGLDWEGARRAWEALAPALDDLDLDLPDGMDRMGAGSPWNEGEWDLAAEAEDACPGLGDAIAGLNGEPWAEDALLTVSMSAFAPFPAGLLAVRAGEGSEEALAAVHDLAVACFATDSAGEQDGTELHLIGDGGDLPLVLARRGDLFLAGTRPDVVRAALRREAGADEASFAGGRVGEALASFDGGFRAGVAMTVLADLVETRLPPMGDDLAVVARERGIAVLRTLAGAALRVDLADEGVVVETLLAIDPEGGDDGLADLLACRDCRASGPFLAPADAVSVAGGPWRPAAWADYVDSWIVDLSAAAGEPTDLRTLLAGWGIDLDRALLDWVGSEAQFMRLEPFSPDLRHLVRQPPSAVVIPVSSAEDAREGLRALADAVLAGLAAAEGSGADLPGPDELAALVSVREETVNDTPYYLVRVGPTAEFAVGAVGARLVLASPERAFERVVAVANGEARTGFGSPGWRAVTAAAGGERIAWAYGDRGADLRGLADLLDLAAQPLAFAASAAFLASEEGGPFGPGSDGDVGADFTVQVVDVATAAGFGTLEVGALDADPLDVPATVEGRLDPNDPDADGRRLDPYRPVGLAAGDVVTVEMTSQVVDTYLYLIDAESGRILAENDDAPTTDRSLLAFRADGATDVVIAASSFGGMGEGPYTLSIVHGAEAATAPADADLLDLADAPRYGAPTLPDEAPHVLQAPVAIDGELSPSDVDATRLDGNLVDVYELTGLNDGELVTVEMTSDPVDTYLFLIDADSGRLVAEVDDSPDTRRSALTFRADATTRVWIGAGSWSGADEGPYRLSVRAERAPDDEPTGRDGAGGDDDAATDDADDPVERAAAPTFDELLPLFEIVPDAVRLVGERLGGFTTVTERGDGTVRTVHRQAFDW